MAVLPHDRQLTLPSRSGSGSIAPQRSHNELLVTVFLTASAAILVNRDGTDRNEERQRPDAQRSSAELRRVGYVTSPEAGHYRLGSDGADHDVDQLQRQEISTAAPRGGGPTA